MVAFRSVDIVFGDHPADALPLIDAGRTRGEIQAETGQIVGVKQATLDVRQGEIVVLMGLSGSGKSTLIRAVNGLSAVTRGTVTVHDGERHVDVHGCGRRRLRALRRSRIAMVFQQFALLPWRTVADNVALGLELDHVRRAERRRRVAEQLELVGLAGWGGKRVDELSGGMQQRVGLARAFATRAPLLLMDEPFSALDPLIRVRLQDELLALQRKLGRTMIFVSHDLDEALKIGTRIAIMEGGSIVQVGTPQEIVLKPSSAYVRDFVAHMNPLNVLRAQEVMTPWRDLPRTGEGAIRIDEDLVLSAACEGWRHGERVQVVPLEAVAAAPHRAIVMAGPETPLRSLIDARLKHTGPFVVGTEAGAVGLIRDEDLFRCLTPAKGEAG
ncbi:choline ABC transporter ATP-binding protein [Rhizobiales bacterium L72]|uniref:Choline ABC transporter ATP-binding protein n=1 Tax=Propylenella binzhouense TaxID=2555902 RepID=A0A964T4P4_9HYPH|nr:choline ABC transporter ATP-binding protein [Propylenella binzhouense]MYZ48294.1 choline ABC transporter ATP-binding protein [Propylenella binzhouense]